MIHSVQMRPLLKGEAYPPETRDMNRTPPKPARCEGCKAVHTPRDPLFKATPMMAPEFITCWYCFQMGKSG